MSKRVFLRASLCLAWGSLLLLSLFGINLEFVDFTKLNNLIKNSIDSGELIDISKLYTQLSKSL